MKVLNKMKAGFKGVVNWIYSFKKTQMTTTLFAKLMTQFFVVFIFGVLSLNGVSYAFTNLGTYWGIFSIFFFFSLSTWLFMKNMHQAKGIVAIIDGFVASLMTFGFVYLLATASIFIGRQLSSQILPSFGWITFAATIAFFAFLFVRLNALYRAND